LRTIKRKEEVLQMRDSEYFVPKIIRFFENYAARIRGKREGLRQCRHFVDN